MSEVHFHFLNNALATENRDLETRSEMLPHLCSFRMWVEFFGTFSFFEVFDFWPPRPRTTMSTKFIFVMIQNEITTKKIGFICLIIYLSLFNFNIPCIVSFYFKKNEQKINTKKTSLAETTKIFCNKKNSKKKNVTFKME